jgi:hypothetical protein
MITKFLKILVLTLTCFFSFAQQEFAEIELIDFNTSATYGSGSSVSVHINSQYLKNGMYDQVFLSVMELKTSVFKI